MPDQTHSDLEGGDLSNPDSLYKKIARALSNDVQAGIRNKLTEILCPARMRFFIDMDIYLKRNERLPKS